jgi:putative spermidine/putrescine transport system substrate-binding protein
MAASDDLTDPNMHEATGLSRRRFLEAGAAAGALAAFPGLLGAAAGAATKKAAAGSPTAKLQAAAKKNGNKLNVIALPRDWANYGEMLDTFAKKYGIKIDSQSPDISSKEELDAIKATKGQKRAPDTVDVGPAFAVQGVTEDLFQPYKGTYWDKIPVELKDPNGMWVGDYYGVMSLGVRTDVAKGGVPKSYADLKDPKYKGQVSLNGDPTSASAAFFGVWAAALANGGSLDDVTPGIKYFADLKKAGNFNPTAASPQTVASGETPIVLDWNYNHVGAAKKFAGQFDWVTSVPSDGVIAGFYCQAISKFAPNLDAAKLWLEFLYSDEGQLIWLKGAAFPARYNELVAAGKVPAALASQLPDKATMAKVKFPTLAQTTKAKETVTKDWANALGA